MRGGEAHYNGSNLNLSGVLGVLGACAARVDNLEIQVAYIINLDFQARPSISNLEIQSSEGPFVRCSLVFAEPAY